MGNPGQGQQHEPVGSEDEHLHDVPSYPPEQNLSFSVDLHPGSYPSQPNPTQVAFPPPGSYTSQPNPTPTANPVAFPPPASYPSQPNPNPVSFPPTGSYPSQPNQNPNPNPVSFPPPGSYPAQPNPVSFPPQGPYASSQNPNPNPDSFPPGSYAFQPNANNVSFMPPGPGVVVVPPSPSNGTPIHQFQVAPRNPWSTSLFDCLDDPENAFITCCFPCVTFGQIAEIIDNGQTSCATGGLIYGAIALFGVPCIYSFGFRSKLRSRYNLEETPGPDWLVHLVCEWCALCQAYRELTKQGWDPSIGWQENMRAKQGVPVLMTPPNPPRMM